VDQCSGDLYAGLECCRLISISSLHGSNWFDRRGSVKGRCGVRELMLSVEMCGLDCGGCGESGIISEFDHVGRERVDGKGCGHRRRGAPHR
jgi:hypothetical protein